MSLKTLLELAEECCRNEIGMNAGNPDGDVVRYWERQQEQIKRLKRQSRQGKLKLVVKI